MLRTEFGAPVSEGRSMSGRGFCRGQDLEYKRFPPQSSCHAQNPALKLSQ